MNTRNENFKKGVLKMISLQRAMEKFDELEKEERLYPEGE